MQVYILSGIKFINDLFEEFYISTTKHIITSIIIDDVTRVVVFVIEVQSTTR